MATKASPSRLALVAVMRAARVRGGYSPEAFARRVGVRRDYYEDVERGSYNVSLETMLKIAAALDCTVAALMREAQI